MPKLYIDLFAEKHLGRKLEQNEDSIFTATAGSAAKKPPEILAVLGVADGMGGPRSGTVASTIVAEYLSFLFMQGGYTTIARQREFPGVDYTALINDTFQILNRKIRERAAALHINGPMGTTCVFGLITYHTQEQKTYLHVGNVGNSRCCILRGDQLFHATEDDNHAWQLYKKGAITYAEMLVHPRRHESTTLGFTESVAPQVHSIELLPNDFVLFSTDGLHEVIDDAVIEEIINKSTSTRAAVKRLAAAAKTAGGTDDIAVALAYCSATPITAATGFNASARASEMTKHKKVSLGMMTAAVVLLLAGAGFYFMNPAARDLVTMLSSHFETRDTLLAAGDADSSMQREGTPRDAAGALGSAPLARPAAPTVIKKRIEQPVRTISPKREASAPKVNVEWNSQTKRFRIKVDGASAIPVKISYGDISFDVVAVKSIPGLYKTTVSADPSSLPNTVVVTIKSKGTTSTTVRVAYTTTD
jgi:PPM family protein phosphatase